MLLKGNEVGTEGTEVLLRSIEVASEGIQVLLRCTERSFYYQKRIT